MTESTQQSAAAPPISAREVAGAVDRRFIRRTAIATILVALLIALFAAVDYSPAWAGRYLLFALWPLGLYAMTGKIFQCMIQGRRGLGFLWIALKVAALAGLYFLYSLFPVPVVDGQMDVAQGSALVFGVVTPFVVVVLRVMGWILEAQRKRAGGGPGLRPLSASGPGANAGGRA